MARLGTRIVRFASNRPKYGATKVFGGNRQTKFGARKGSKPAGLIQTIRGNRRGG